jgi:hypothetical protein
MAARCCGDSCKLALYDCSYPADQQQAHGRWNRRSGSTASLRKVGAPSRRPQRIGTGRNHRLFVGGNAVTSLDPKPLEALARYVVPLQADILEKIVRQIEQPHELAPLLHVGHRAGDSEGKIGNPTNVSCMSRIHASHLSSPFARRLFSPYRCSNHGSIKR